MGGGFDESVHRPEDVLDHLFGQTGIHTYEEGIRRNHIAVGQRAHYPMLDAFIRRMPQQVSAEQIARLDPRALQCVNQFSPRERCLRPDGND